MQAEITVTHPAKIDARARSIKAPDIADPIIKYSAMGVVKLQFNILRNNEDYIAKEPMTIEVVKTLEMLTEAQYNQKIVNALTNGSIEMAQNLLMKLKLQAQ